MNLNIEDNKSVIIALKMGDEKAFETVYCFYFRKLCAFCSRYIDQQHEVEEIVQETMLWLWESRHSLMEELNLKSLLFTIVKNKSLNRISHIDIKRRVHAEIEKKYQSIFHDPDFYFSNDELFTLYRHALDELPKEIRDAFEMNRNKNLTHKEIAHHLGVSPQTVNYRIGKALKYLREALKDFLPLLMGSMYCAGWMFG